MRRFCFTTGLLLVISFASAQDLEVTQPISTVSSEFLKKGNVIFDLDRILNYSSNKIELNGVKYGETSRFNIDLGASLMLSNNWGAGVDLSFDHSKFENGVEVIENSWMAWGHALYGRDLGNTVDFIIKAGAGYGGIKEKTTGSTFPSEQDISTVGIRASVLFPIRVQGGPVFLTPSLGYKRLMLDYDDGEETQSNVRLGLNLMTSLGKTDHRCDGRFNHQQANTRYDAGSHYIGYYTKGMFSLGGYETEFGSNTEKSDVSEGSLRLDYNYYFINNFYGGVELMWSSEVFEPGYQPNYKYTDSKFMIEPKIGLNIPGKAPLNNTFLEFAYGFGSLKEKVDDNGNVDEFKDKLSSYSGTLGYNIFFADQVALTPMIRYNVMKSEADNSSFNNEEEQKGLQFRVGLRFFLDR